jgi:ABC-2 type transport system ATP-binding protein
VTDPAIAVRDLTREYGGKAGKNGVTALSGVSFEAPAGIVFGLLGPNGAGKTTLTRILATLLTPTSGTASVLGMDVVRDVRALRRRVSVVFGGDQGLYDRLSGRDNLRYFATLYAVPPRAAATRIAELLDVVGLTGAADRRVETYSRGMRQRLHLARGLLHRPEVLLLDEPTIGIDPLGAREIRALVQALRERGLTILLTTHYMLEADELCDDIAIIDHGRLVARGRPEELKAQADLDQVVEVTLPRLPDELIGRLGRVDAVHSLDHETADTHELLVVRVRAGASLGELLGVLSGAAVDRVTMRSPSLEDAYVALLRRPGAAAGVAEQA